MACPTIEVSGKTVILLNGFEAKAPLRGQLARKCLKIEAERELRKSANRHPDAVAFGYVAGRWLPAA